MASAVIDVVAAAVWDGVDSLLIGQRSVRDSFPGVWEFVGGKREAGESLEEALHREIKEELDIEIFVLERIGATDFSNGDLKFRLHLYFAVWKQGIPRAVEHDEIQWVRSLDSAHRNWSTPDRPFLDEVEQRLLRRIHMRISS
jgi:8-oxo-dGTP diphosphatase